MDPYRVNSINRRDILVKRYNLTTAPFSVFLANQGFPWKIRTTMGHYQPGPVTVPRSTVSWFLLWNISCFCCPVPQKKDV